ncbi:radical SAM protein [Geobacter sp.]|uniref:radical SAM protein n=1 Tax=Geobacter sp. TaxID=46610 RepID=UPI00260DA5E7|nr:radical SAM protein [Geobacter sp.]
MNINHYYRVYNRLKTGKLVCWAVNTAKLFRIRHLLVRMDTNFMCNLRCKTCYFSAQDAHKSFIPAMSLENFRSIAEMVFPQTRILYLSCGAEPFLTNGFERYIQIAGQYHIPYTGYITNGLLFTEDIIVSSVENRITEITISIDGATKETYEYIRQGGNFDQLMSKLQLYQDTVARFKKPLPLLRFNYTVTRTNYQEMPLLVDLAARFGVSTVKFRIYEDWGGALDFKEESLLGHERSFNESLAEAKLRAHKAGINIIAPKEFALEERKMAREQLDPMQKNIAPPPCIYPWFFRYINPEGRVRVCANLPLSSGLLCPSWNLKDFEQSEAEKVRKKLLTKQPDFSCFKTVCGGAYQARANENANFLCLKEPS